MSLDVEVRGISGIVANIHAADRRIGGNIRAAMRERGKAQQADTKAAAPRRTGFLAEHTRLGFSPEGLTYTVGYSEADFASAGHPPYFYYVIYGTSQMAANPYLFNVHEEHRARVTAAIGGAVRSGVGGRS